MENSPNQQPQNPNKETGMAVVAYILFFIPLLTSHKNDKFVQFHVKQGFLIFIGWIVSAIISNIHPIAFLGSLLDIAILILLIIGIMNALEGKEKQLPIIGHLADKININF